MPLNCAELEKFYEGLVVRARHRGISCAITSSGMARVAFGAAQATKDCDLLCEPEGAGKFLGLLEEASLRGHLPSYRGHFTPPLDARWLRGGWTSHFVWDAAGARAYLTDWKLLFARRHVLSAARVGPARPRAGALVAAGGGETNSRTSPNGDVEGVGGMDNCAATAGLSVWCWRPRRAVSSSGHARWDSERIVCRPISDRRVPERTGDALSGGGRPRGNKVEL